MKALTFGEVMMRLTPPGSGTIADASSFTMHIGGSEFNVAAGLCSLGHDARFITWLPDNSLGKLARSSIRSHGVALDSDVFTPDGRLGTYYLEKGASPRPNRVIYDRTGSAFSLASAESFDWNSLLTGADWFHVSGITPALSSSLSEAVESAITTANGLTIPVSFDINYRTSLWSESDARKTLEPMIRKSSVLFTTEEDLQRVFGLDAKEPEKLASEAKELFDVDVVAITLREIVSVNFNRWSGCAFGPDGFTQSRVYDVEIIDRVGAGDSFTAGFLAVYEQGSVPQAIETGAAFSALKQTIHGDVCTATMSDVEALIEKGGPGRIQR